VCGRVSGFFRGTFGLDETENYEGFEALAVVKECLGSRYLWFPSLLVGYMCFSTWLMIVFHPILGFFMSALLIFLIAKQHKSAETKNGSGKVAEDSGFKWDVERSFDDYQQLLERRRMQELDYER
jgi:hypothetical protein